MKIISWNVNGLRAVERKGDWKVFLQTHDPDIVLIQETKAQAAQLAPIDAAYPDYDTFYVSAKKKGYSGTGIWLKKSFGKTVADIEFTAGMPEDPCATEGRIARIDFKKEGQSFSVLGIYFPNGGKSPDAWADKLVFYEKILAYVNQLRDEGKTVIWGGDVNCAHQPIDLARPESNEGNIGFHPAERAWLDRWQAEGWIDLWRAQNPEVREVYSWWHVITRARLRNIGWRIDYFFSSQLSPLPFRLDYLSDQMGSDHCPVRLEV